MRTPAINDNLASTSTTEQTSGANLALANLVSSQAKRVMTEMLTAGRQERTLDNHSFEVLSD